MPQQGPSLVHHSPARPWSLPSWAPLQPSSSPGRCLDAQGWGCSWCPLLLTVVVPWALAARPWPECSPQLSSYGNHWPSLGPSMEEELKEEEEVAGGHRCCGWDTLCCWLSCQIFSSHGHCTHPTLPHSFPGRVSIKKLLPKSKHQQKRRKAAESSSRRQNASVKLLCFNKQMWGHVQSSHALLFIFNYGIITCCTIVLWIFLEKHPY